jgi:hypothetical protein
MSALDKDRKRSLELESTFPVVHKKMKKTMASEKSDEGSTATHSLSSIHTGVSDIKGKNRRRYQTSNISPIDRPNGKTSTGQPDVPPCKDSSRSMPSSILSPLFCDKSLRNLFNDPCGDLARRFGYPPSKITSDKDAFLDCVNQQMTKMAAVGGQDSIPGIVLVHWPSPRDVFNGVKSWLSELEGHGSFLSQSGAGEISFLDWKALEVFASPPQDILRSAENFSCGSIICTD